LDFDLGLTLNLRFGLRLGLTKAQDLREKKNAAKAARSLSPLQVSCKKE
jgi:hypothetical protein